VNNYQMLATWAASLGGRVLDYGCGAGEIVAELRERGIDAHGCDVFYEGGDYSKNLKPAAAPYISRMGATIPHADASFDVVISNQVLEHVQDLPAASHEIARVLKPGGVCIHVFPHRGVWREGHCGVPFLHRFAKGSRARFWYGAIMRKLGIAFHKDARRSREWSRHYCQWLDRWTYYRSRAELDAIFASDFAVTHREDLLLDAKRHLPIPGFAKRIMVRKLAGVVLFMRKAH
jgi:SAM-dependent methyltransferase